MNKMNSYIVIIISFNKDYFNLWVFLQISASCPCLWVACHSLAVKSLIGSRTKWKNKTMRSDRRFSVVKWYIVISYSPTTHKYATSDLRSELDIMEGQHLHNFVK